MRNRIRAILEVFRIPSIEDREYRYLCGAFSRENLEYRQGEIDRGLFRNSW
ncbi:MAG: DUF3563 domain-containing protein [Paracoccaceae bacterium]|nr:DUF3563 domain-containing protein [Paracoccaceae bacterium]